MNARFYRVAWVFYLVLAIAGLLWTGAQRGRLGLALFVDPGSWWIDLGAGCLLGGGLLVLWWALRRGAAAARALEEELSRLLAPLTAAEAISLAIISALAEELFFRGAAYAAFPPRVTVIATTALYAASTLFSGVLLLTFAAACLGLLTASQRRVTGGVLGPIASHLTWSLGMLFLLPPAFALGA